MLIGYSLLDQRLPVKPPIEPALEVGPSGLSSEAKDSLWGSPIISPSVDPALSSSQATSPARSNFDVAATAAVNVKAEVSTDAEVHSNAEGDLDPKEQGVPDPKDFDDLAIPDLESQHDELHEFLFLSCLILY